MFLDKHSTVARRTLIEDLRFTSISNDDLDDIIKDIKVGHPNDGEGRPLTC